MKRLKLNFLILLIFCALKNIHTAPSPQKERYCIDYNINPEPRSQASYNDFSDELSDNTSEYVDNVVVNKTSKPKKQLCEGEFLSCYTVWTINENGTANISRQGCWKSDAQCLNENCLSNTKLTNQKNQYYFCCCSDDYCNSNFTLIDQHLYIDSSVIDENNNQLVLDIPYTAALICLSITGIILISVIIFILCRLSSKSEPELALLSAPGPGYSSNLNNVDNLKLCAMIGQGKYGTVWKGIVNESPVAVKIFPAQYKQYFLNERDIYTTPIMDSPNILSYFGCDQRRNMGDHIEYLLVLSLAPLGCLQDWLVENTTSFQIFHKMAQSITRGISHLHTQINKGDVVKPCICHRDLNSRNILVKSDLSCCICDFGFALKTFGARYEYKGELTLAETKSINEVGTLRYMAPEILEGAVNLRDCESALKQIDIYALGLILWELSIRCHDFYTSQDMTQAYMAPYEAETGKHPSFEQMQVLVSRHKARPVFPSNWDGCQAVKIIKDTCEDCWDHDAEARLTAVCVEERLQELYIFHTQFIKQSPHSPQNVPYAQDHLNISPNQNNTFFTQNSITAPPNKIIPKGFHSELSNGRSDHAAMKNKELLYNQFQREKVMLSINNKNQILIDKMQPHNFSDYSESQSCENDRSSGELLPENGPTTSFIAKLKGWNSVRAILENQIFRKTEDFNEKSYLFDSDVNYKSNEPPIQNGSGTTNTEIPSDSVQQRPNNLNIHKSHSTDQYHCNNSLKNNNNNVSAVKCSPQHHFEDEPVTRRVKKLTSQLSQDTPRIVISQSANAVKNLSSIEMLSDKQITRQRSLEIFREVFNSREGCERLRDPSQRVKTPGDVPPSVRKVRASKTLSLYDDRMMDTSGGNTL